MGTGGEDLALRLLDAGLDVVGVEPNLIGGEWLFFYGLGVGLELVLLAVILRSAWTWPRATAPSMPGIAAPSAPQLQMGR